MIWKTEQGCTHNQDKCGADIATCSRFILHIDGLPIFVCGFGPPCGVFYPGTVPGYSRRFVGGDLGGSAHCCGAQVDIRP